VCGETLKDGFEDLIKGEQSIYSRSISTQTQKLLSWKKDVFGSFIPFIGHDSQPFFSFFTFNQPDDQYSCNSETGSDYNFFGFHFINTLKYLSKIDV